MPEVRGVFPGHGDARNAKGCPELGGGQSSVAHAGAEGDGSHRVRVADVPANRLGNVAHPDAIGPVDVLELARRVSPSLPRPANVGAVVDREVVERHEDLPIDGFPEAQFGRPRTVEVLVELERLPRTIVHPFRGGGEAQEHRWLQPGEKLDIRGRSAVVNLVHDHHVVGRRVELADPATERLDGSEDVSLRIRSLPVHEQASERRLAQHGTERIEALLEDALPVGHEEEGIDGPSAEPLPSAGVCSRAPRPRSSPCPSPQPRGSSCGCATVRARGPRACDAGSLAVERRGARRSNCPPGGRAPSCPGPSGATPRGAEGLPRIRRRR